VECTARLGKGKEHAKNQGGVSVGYKHLQRIVEDGEYEEDTVRGVVETPDGDLLDLSEHGNSLDEAFDGDVGVEDITDAFVFSVESDGSLPPEELVERAAESISSRADKLRDRVTA
ncbi:MAG: DNA-directed RNA polymerase subunit D, partial [Halobacteria archaeon]|nr:DNA-directed RNA polymerase subunit D [Halobacteria archaeon]